VITVKREQDFILFFEDGHEFYDINAGVVGGDHADVEKCINHIKRKSWITPGIISYVEKEFKLYKNNQ